METKEERGAFALTPRFTQAVDYARQIHVGTRKKMQVPYMTHLLRAPRSGRTGAV